MKMLRIKPIKPVTELRGFFATASDPRTMRDVVTASGAMSAYEGDFVVVDEIGPCDVLRASEVAQRYTVSEEKKRGRKPKSAEAVDPRQLSVEGHLAGAEPEVTPEVTPEGESVAEAIASRRKRK